MDTPGKVLVYGARWCPITGPLSRSLTKAGVEVEVVDCEKDPWRADKARVASLPTVVVLIEDSEVARFAGVVSPREVKQALRRAPQETLLEEGNSDEDNGTVG